MGTEEHPDNKTPTSPASPPIGNKQPSVQLVGKAGKVLIGVVTLLATIAGVLTLSPRVTLKVQEPNKTDPFSTVFSIENDGLLAVKDVVVRCIIGRAVFQSPGKQPNKFTNSAFLFDEAITPLIRPGGEFTTQCHRAARSMLSRDSPAPLVGNADFAIELFYSPAYTLGWQRREVFILAATKQSDGTWLIENRGQQ
jgi:hypothetical protein